MVTDQMKSSKAMDHQRVAWDLPAYRAQVHSGCFICRFLAGDLEYAHHVAYRDDVAVVFLNRYPQVRGHLLVAPIPHREQVADDFSAEDYLDLQAVIYRAAKAVAAVVPTERLYLMSLGSPQGNRHVHWHLVPCPVGLPYDQQQMALFETARGYLQVRDPEQAELAADIARAMK
jgi:diadenosine tetraphosphate (Ap4A) HIT family hydrolase